MKEFNNGLQYFAVAPLGTSRLAAIIVKEDNAMELIDWFNESSGLADIYARFDEIVESRGYLFSIMKEWRAWKDDTFVDGEYVEHFNTIDEAAEVARHLNATEAELWNALTDENPLYEYTCYSITISSASGDYVDNVSAEDLDLNKLAIPHIS